ncbi:Fe-S cluster assembly protein SufD [Salinispirillum sp. LH 10-3-1]|uniref:Fe-S cluster assembly protein SufD n=1 Tax=Salinispirillum sp. LH 10-3-1 TaxID=2952525 RepID=A0AB38YDL8_9GAMM
MTTSMDFQQQALNLAAQQQSPAWLADVRAAGATAWQNAKWPDRRTEHWKYTPLQALQADGFAQWAQGGDWQGDVEFLAVDAHRLVFVNGQLNEALSTALPANVVRFDQASSAQQALIAQHLGSAVDLQRHLFAALSNACAADGWLYHLAPDVQADKPLYLVHLSTPEAQPAMAQQRLLVVLERHAKAEVIEHYVSTTEVQNGFVNSLTELVVGDGAQLQHYRLNLEEENLLHVGGVHADLYRSAQLNAFALGQGSRLKRVDYHVRHKGEGAHLGLNGVYLPRNRQRIDYHTTVEHCVPHCTTDENFRGIIADSAKAVFNGRIHIHKDAQKTLAELSNKNLLTSNQAEIDTKPELEIYADDVKCAHGATVSQLNETAMYYLQSRGVSKAEAEVMLSFGFINELLQQVEQEAIQLYLRPRLAALFGSDDELTRHIVHD